MNAIQLIDTVPLVMRVGGESHPSIPLRSTHKHTIRTIAGDMERDLAPIDVSIVRPHRTRITLLGVRTRRDYIPQTADAVDLVEVRRMKCLVDRVTGVVFCCETGVCLSSCQMWLT